MNDTSGEKPKIIIDEDWKSQVQAEKEALQKAAATETANPPSAAAGAQAAESASRPAAELPPASLALLISMLATQAMIALGQIPLPDSKEPKFHPDEARHFIDLLQVLDEKTAGNRTPDESRMLEAVLHELRMSFVAAGGSRPAG